MAERVCPYCSSRWSEQKSPATARRDGRDVYGISCRVVGATWETPAEIDITVRVSLRGVTIPTPIALEGDAVTLVIERRERIA